MQPFYLVGPHSAMYFQDHRAFNDDKTAKALEPFTPRPSTRLKVIEALAKRNYK